MSWYRPADVGLSARQTLAEWGHGARMLLHLFTLFGASFKRFRLVRDQVFFLGNHSLAIISVSAVARRNHGRAGLDMPAFMPAASTRSARVPVES